MQRPVVVLPQPDSPTRPSVSPRRIEKLTSSTARTRPEGPPKSPPPTVKCLTRWRTSSSTSEPAAARAPPAAVGTSAGGLILPLQPRRLPARAHVAGLADGLEGWRLDGAALHAERAARGERAARRQPCEIGRLALDRRQSRAARLVQPRHRAQQPERVGMAGRVIDVA